MPQTFAPSFATLRGRLPIVIPLLLLFGFIDYFGVHQPLPNYLVEFGGLVVLCACYVWLYFRNTRVEVDKQSLVRRNAFGRRRAFADADVASVVIVNDYTFSGQSGPTYPRLFVLTPEGRAVLRWNGMYWPRDEMNSLATTLGVPLTTLGSLTTRDFVQRYPRAVSSIEAHPYRWGIGIAAGLIAVITIVVIAIVGT